MMNENRHTPLLSICIPTYNRACLLEQMLRSLVPQVKAFSPEVELIVSDNCSTDNTREVVEQASKWGPIRYHRNAQNEGSARNILIATTELAHGEFCWILGDDDMVIKGKLDKIVGVLNSNPSLDYFFVNYFFKLIQERDVLIREHDSLYTPKPAECMCRDFSDHYLGKWEQLLSIDNANPGGMFSAIVCHMFRRSLWSAHSHVLSLENDEQFSSLDNSFPHAKILAHAMVGKPVYYIGDPCVLLGQQSQEWSNYWPLLSTVRLQELLDLYLELGVEVERVEKCRRALLGHSLEALAKMLVDPTTPGRQYFSFEEFLRRNRFHQPETRDTNYSIKGNPDLPFVFRQETLSSLYLNIGYNYLRKNDKSQFFGFLVRAVATWPLNCQLYASLAKNSLLFIKDRVRPNRHKD